MSVLFPSKYSGRRATWKKEGKMLIKECLKRFLQLSALFYLWGIKKNVAAKVGSLTEMKNLELNVSIPRENNINERHLYLSLKLCQEFFTIQLFIEADDKLPIDIHFFTNLRYFWLVPHLCSFITRSSKKFYFCIKSTTYKAIRLNFPPLNHS